MKKLLIAAALLCGTPIAAHAFCGFFIDAGTGGDMFNNATEVVLMRAGTRTVLAMQNNYQGPVKDFALVVPVPTVLHEGDVKTIDPAIFAKVDRMSSPRLVEYWEQDPCAQGRGQDDEDGAPMASGAMAPRKSSAEKEDAYHVTIEAKFVVGEYNVVILSAKDSTGLDGYLRSEHYQIPKGAEPLLRPYVEGGMKFFVAKVDPKKVRFVNGQAMLSPLRFHYDSEEFALPIRLGLANSHGVQDLIVNILSPDTRYELANYKNVTIPTNLDVRDVVRGRFGEFYAALFDRTIAANPGAVVTEYAWDASSCDPCPGPELDGGDFATLGADVIGDKAAGTFVLTRLHARYGTTGAPNDLVFRAGKPIVGGREERDAHGQLEERSRISDDVNNFQGRYAIRHPWTGPVACANPVRGVWGEDPNGNGGGTIAVPAVDTAFAPRGQIALPTVVVKDIPELGIVAGVASGPLGFHERPQGCGCQSGGVGDVGGGLVVVGYLGFMWRRRRTR